MIKVYEVMKLAAENPQEYEGKRYKVVNGSPLENGSQIFYECVICKGSFKSPSKSLYLAAFNDAQLEEIPQPVSFMEAVKAYSEGKTVKCHIEGTTYLYDYFSKSNAYEFNFFIGGDGHVVACREILRGTWYIKD